MAFFLDLGFVPSSGFRQPRIQYRVDDPSMNDLEEFRRVFGSQGHGTMSQLYVEALLIGARIMLDRESSGAGGVAAPSKSNAPPAPDASSVPARADVASPEGNLRAAVLPTEAGESAVKKPSKAASSQFDQFG